MSGLAPHTDHSEHNARLAVLTQEMFDKVAAYVRAELETTCEDYKLLETLNRLTAQRYGELTTQTATMNESLQVLFDKYASLEKYILQIDQIEAGVAQLEETVRDLDAYSRQLEERFGTLQYR
eukprot:comp12203_c0_seq1/m.6973 comp12203_c0_seq1/g.6973  ORF comp12203_c0_seq1/g.6973 comp12203_c0_seq1/m.6973 type:complete len:123 (-) comp12203_c0_seq1:23-391(-)